MPRRSLEQIDLNLLIHLRRLLEEEHVGKAAKASGLSDSAMSRKLARLRELFDDPLLTTHGRGLTRTAFADELRPRLHEVLAEVESALFARTAFRPETAEATWTLAATDSTHFLFSGRLLGAVMAEAPHLTLRFVAPDVLFEGGLSDGRAQAALGPIPTETNYQTLVLFRQSFLTLSPSSLVRGRKRIGIDAFCRTPHALVSPRGRPGSIVDDALAKRGRTRKVVATLEHFNLAPELVREAGVLVTLPALVARAICPPDLCVVTPPVPLPTLRAGLTWHARLQHDEGHQWWRKHIARVVKARARELQT